jgi:hypothetical protein
MPDLPGAIAPFIGHRPTLLFSAILTLHVLAGMACVATGAVAALSPKHRGRHPAFGQVYFWAMGVVFVTSSGMSLLRWPEDGYLFVLGTVAFSFALFGVTARRRRWAGWTTAHVVGMSASYVVLLTAFYVDNGPRLPLWKELPPIAFWIGPTLIGLPIIARGLARHTRVRHDLRALLHLRNAARAQPRLGGSAAELDGRIGPQSWSERSWHRFREQLVLNALADSVAHLSLSCAEMSMPSSAMALIASGRTCVATVPAENASN